MVKPLTFKGDKPKKKRKRAAAADDDDDPTEGFSTKALARPSDANNDDNEEDDSWVTAEAVSDIAGPVTVVLPTEAPSFLASDANGKVFASAVENMIEGDALTAEPHDVRQVWVATRLVGTENFSFKGHHGKYLGCDKYGVLSAHREAISPEETFTLIPVADNPGTFALQTPRDKFVAATTSTNASSKPKTSAAATDTLRGDTETIDYTSSLRIRMQARFKPRQKKQKEQKAQEKISRKELEELAGRRLNDDEVRKLKKARREGNFHESMLDLKAKSKHDKFA
ncbi:FRG1-like family protein [Phyllosticta citriasiana]|uniref:FRG1-like family protein n=1 Tax=Phyllosticta citriasiana TaxID=595635 RepID=A0ABR1KEL7_9PEZI